MSEIAEQAVFEFCRYPSVGDDDWRYAFATARVRALETQMLSRTTLLDIANAESFEQAVELLSSSEYSLPQNAQDFADIENTLTQRRSELWKLFTDLIIDEPIVEPLRVYQDFANMRLALRRKLTDKPVGTDYSDDGSVRAEEFVQIFDQENYGLLPYHMQEAIERAVLAYYENKDIRQIDYALDNMHFEYKLGRAKQLRNIFLIELFRMQVDLTNIRTMLRLKFTESEQREVFINGGYIEKNRLKQGVDAAYEAVAGLFFATPYYELVDSGISYLVSNKSFLKLEANCDAHLTGYLKSTARITAGPQPIIAYLIMKENEIRTVRLILTGKKNALEKRLILDRLGE